MHRLNAYGCVQYHGNAVSSFMPCCGCEDMFIGLPRGPESWKYSIIRWQPSYPENMHRISLNYLAQNGRSHNFKYQEIIIFEIQPYILSLSFLKNQALIYQFIWIRVAVSKLVITVDWFNAYRNRKAVQNALHIHISHHC